MKKERNLFILLCLSIILMCASCQKTENKEAAQSEEAAEKESSYQEQLESDTTEESECTPEQQWDENETIWANMHESKINYMDGYYYYASQSDHYYLYRVKEDGSNPQCLAKVHVSDICVQDGEIFFINQSDDGIYRMKADGTELKKLCENGEDLQISTEYVYFYSKSLYRMKKDGSEKVLINKGVGQYVLSGEGHQEIGDEGAIYYAKSNDEGMTVYKMDLNGQNAKEVCHFEESGKMIVYRGNIYCSGSYYIVRDGEKVTWFCPENGEMNSFAVPEYTDRCFYKGYFYGICEQGEKQRKISLYRVDLRNGNIEVLYEDEFSCEYSYGVVSDIYATEQGIFFRKFVSEQEGCRWFRLTENADVQEWEDREKIPVALPARNEYTDYLSVLFGLESTQGYEAYLAEGLECEEYFFVDEVGEPHNPCKIELPQFNGNIAGYQKINQYIQNVYQEALQEKEAFFQKVKEEEEVNPLTTLLWEQYMGYEYIYIGEKYMTVGICGKGYRGGIRRWIKPEPVTFDKTTGEVVSLENVLEMPMQEAVAALTGSVYKYMEGIGRGHFFLKEWDFLTYAFNPEQFFLLPDGIGVYYEIYEIGCGAEGDYLFIVPWEDLGSGYDK